MDNDHVDEMIAVDNAFRGKDLVRILLLKAGICDDSTLSNIVHADDDAIDNLLVDIYLSAEFKKLLSYLRS